MTTEQIIAKATQKANKETTAWIKRRKFSPWQLANETGIQNEVDAYWIEALKFHRDELTVIERYADYED